MLRTFESEMKYGGKSSIIIFSFKYIIYYKLKQVNYKTVYAAIQQKITWRVKFSIFDCEIQVTRQAGECKIYIRNVLIINEKHLIGRI